MKDSTKILLLTVLCGVNLVLTTWGLLLVRSLAARPDPSALTLCAPPDASRLRGGPVPTTMPGVYQGSKPR